MGGPLGNATPVQKDGVGGYARLLGTMGIVALARGLRGERYSRDARVPRPVTMARPSCRVRRPRLSVTDNVTVLYPGTGRRCDSSGGGGSTTLRHHRIAAIVGETSDGRQRSGVGPKTTAQWSNRPASWTACWPRLMRSAKRGAALREAMTWWLRRTDRLLTDMDLEGVASDMARRPDIAASRLFDSLGLVACAQECVRSSWHGGGRRRAPSLRRVENAVSPIAPTIARWARACTSRCAIEGDTKADAVSGHLVHSLLQRAPFIDPVELSPKQRK